MSSNAFNTGIDRVVQLTDQVSGQVFTFTQTANGSSGMGGDLIRFSSEPDTNDIEIPSLSNGGVRKMKHARRGWHGTIVIGRVTGEMDALEADQQARWVSGIQSRVFTLDEITNNVDAQTTDHFRYTNCAVKLTNAGQWELERNPEITLEFQGGQRVNVGATPI